MVRSTAIVLSALLLATSGCTTVPRDAATGELLAARNQRFEYDEVRRRARDLQEGMPMGEVMILLGSPAIRERDSWIYMPKREALLMPGEAMRVRFRNGRYVGHGFEPIVLDSRLDI